MDGKKEGHAKAERNAVNPLATNTRTLIIPDKDIDDLEGSEISDMEMMGEEEEEDEI